VLVAEELFVSGCRLLVTMTSAGQLVELRSPPYFLLIEKALREEGTRYHDLPAAEFSHADPTLLGTSTTRLRTFVFPSKRAPLGQLTRLSVKPRMRSPQCATMKRKGLLAVEMKAAALYGFSAPRRKPVLCFAHVTNEMALNEGDFDKGEAGGTFAALAVIAAATQALRGVDL
jgi:hypothetical protein